MLGGGAGGSALKDAKADGGLPQVFQALETLSAADIKPPPSLQEWLMELQVVHLVKEKSVDGLVALGKYDTEEDKTAVIQTFGGSKQAIGIYSFPEDKRADMVQKYIYDLLTTLLWDAEGSEFAAKALEGVKFLDDKLPSESATVMADIRACFVPWADHCVTEWQRLRNATKGPQRLMRQFANLPLGIKLVAGIDSYVISTKRTKLSLDKLERLKKDMQQFAVPDLKKVNVDTFVATQAKHRKDLVVISSGLDDATKADCQSALAEFDQHFGRVIVALCNHFALRFHTSVCELVASVLKGPADGEDRDKFVTGALEAVELCMCVPEAAKVNIEEIGSAEDARSWVASRKKLSQIVDGLKLGVQVILTDTFPDMSAMPTLCTHIFDVKDPAVSN